MERLLLAVVLAAGLAMPQTRIVPPDNNYTPAQDVELGLQAAAEAERQLPVLRDDEVTSYIESLGHRFDGVVLRETTTAVTATIGNVDAHDAAPASKINSVSKEA